MLKFEDTTLAAVIEARNILEPAVARLAARDITPEGLRRLEETIANRDLKVRSTPRSGQRFQRRDQSQAALETHHRVP